MSTAPATPECSFPQSQRRRRRRWPFGAVPASPTYDRRPYLDAEVYSIRRTINQKIPERYREGVNHVDNYSRGLGRNL